MKNPIPIIIDEAEMMTAEEVAYFLKIHIKTVYDLAKSGALPAHHVGRSWRFNRSEVLKATLYEKTNPENSE